MTESLQLIVDSFIKYINKKYKLKQVFGFDVVISNKLNSGHIILIVRKKGKYLFLIQNYDCLNESCEMYVHNF